MRYSIIFSGRVQGVGFRYATVKTAGKFDVGGWVRNMPDGTVHCVAEGEAAELDRFVAAVQQRMDGYISDTSVRREEATAEFEGFDVRF